MGTERGQDSLGVVVGVAAREPDHLDTGAFARCYTWAHGDFPGHVVSTFDEVHDKQVVPDALAAIASQVAGERGRFERGPAVLSLGGPRQSARAKYGRAARPGRRVGRGLLTVGRPSASCNGHHALPCVGASDKVRRQVVAAQVVKVQVLASAHVDRGAANDGPAFADRLALAQSMRGDLVPDR